MAPIELRVKGVPVPHAGATTVSGVVAVCGQGEELGNWNPENAPTLAAAETEGVFAGIVEAAPGANFKYVLLARKRPPQWEGNRPNRILHVLEDGEEPDDHVFDELDAHELEIMRENEPQPAPPVSLTLQGVPNVGGGNVITKVAVVGEGDVLGNWDPKRAPLLQPVRGAPGVFSGDITCEVGAFYKYVVMAGDEMRWEQSRPDRAFPDAMAGALEWNHHFDKIEVFEDQSVYLPQDQRRAKSRRGSCASAMSAEAAAALYGGPAQQPPPPAAQWRSVVPDEDPTSAKETNLIWEAVPGARTERMTIFHAFHVQYRDIIPKVHEIKQMGFDALQISPAQKSKSGHEWWARYQPQDYLSIDGMGSEDELKHLCHVANEIGLMIIGDVVFNHMIVVAGCHEWKKAQKDEVLEEELWKRLEDAVGPTFDREDFAPWHPMLGDDWDNENRFEGWGNGEWSELKYCPKVVDVQQQHIEKLFCAGVRGIRFDAAKHMRPAHLKEHVDWAQKRLPGAFCYHEVLSADERMHAEYDSAPTMDFKLASCLRELWRTGALPRPSDGSPVSHEEVRVPLLPGDSVRFARNHDTVANTGAPIHGLDWSRSEAALATSALLSVHDGSVLLLAEDAWGSGAVRAALLFRAQLKQRYGALCRTEMKIRWKPGVKPCRAPPARLTIGIYSQSGACVGAVVMNLTRKVVAVGQVPQLAVEGAPDATRSVRALAGLADDADPEAEAARCEVADPEAELSPSPAPVEDVSKLWEIVGGADKGGILVRTGQDLKSEQAAERLSTGAVVEEIELLGERLHYKLVRGTGPVTGWVSTTLSGKALALKTSARSGSSGSLAWDDDKDSGKWQFSQGFKPSIEEVPLKLKQNGAFLFGAESAESEARLVLAPRSALFLLPEVGNTN